MERRLFMPLPIVANFQCNANAEQLLHLARANSRSLRPVIDHQMDLILWEFEHVAENAVEADQVLDDQKLWTGYDGYGLRLLKHRKGSLAQHDSQVDDQESELGSQHRESAVDKRRGDQV